MASPDNQVLEKVMEVGYSLLNYLSSVNQLLSLLDKLENFLTSLDQAPDTTVKDALMPSMSALISDELFRHSDMDVKISVISCIAEITRITAPEAPFNDQQMKEIFKLTVAAFEKLSDVSGRCYEKAILIVDNVARVRSCLLMLDLECDDLIIEMFQHFLRAIRSNHPHFVKYAMETIMTLVLDESEEVSVDLLRPLLDSVTKENQTNSPISWSLGEKVITNCADKLQPYLLRAVQSTGKPLDAFAQIVVSICQRESETPQCNHLNGSKNSLVQADENKLAESKDVDEQPSDVTMGLEPDMTCARDAAETMDDVEPKKRKASASAMNDKKNNAKPNSKNGDFEAAREPKSEPELDTMRMKRGRRPNSLMNPEEGYDNSWISKGKKSAKSVQSRKVRTSGCDFPSSETPASREDKLLSKPENDGEVSEPKTKKTIKAAQLRKARPSGCDIPSSEIPASREDQLLSEPENDGEVSEPKTKKTIKAAQLRKAQTSGSDFPSSESPASQKDNLPLEPKNAGELSQPKIKKTTKAAQSKKACDNGIELSPSANPALQKEKFSSNPENMTEGCEGSEALESQPKTDKNTDAASLSTNHSIPEGSPASREDKLLSKPENDGEVSQPKTIKASQLRKARDNRTGVSPSENPASQKDKLPLELKNAGELSQPKIKKTTKAAQSKKACDNGIELSPSANPALQKEKFSSNPENMTEGCEGSEALESQPKTDKNANAANPSTNLSIPEISPRKRGRPRKNSITYNQGVDPKSLSMVEEDHSIAQLKDNSSEPPSLKSKKGSAEAKIQEPLSKIKLAAKTDKKTSMATESIVSEMECKSSCEEEEKPKSVKNIEAANKKRKRLDATPNKDPNDPSIIKMKTKSATKTLNGVEETPQTRPRKKGTAVCVEASEIRNCNEPLVGSRIKVWWPLDKRFYEGIVDSYDSVKGKHKISYVDGDVEVLNLKKQRWELIVDHDSPDAKQGINVQKLEAAASDISEKRKGNSGSESSKGANVDSRPTSRGRTSSARTPKSVSAKSAGKSEEEPVVAEESMVDSPRTKNKLETAPSDTSEKRKGNSGSESSKGANVDSRPTSRGRTSSARTPKSVSAKSAGKSEEEPVVADESMVDSPRTKNKLETAPSDTSEKRKGNSGSESSKGANVNSRLTRGKTSARTLKSVSAKSAGKSEDEDEPVVADESMVDSPKTKNKQQSSGKSRTKTPKTVSDTKKLKSGTESVKKSKLQKAPKRKESS